MTPALRDRLERCRTLPYPSPLGLHLLRVLERENFDVAELGRVIGADQGLSAKLVRLSNLALSEQKREATSVAQALMLLGAPTVCQLALTLSLTREVRRVERNGFDHAWFWQRSLLAGIALRAIARSQGLGRADEAFLAAYLQDFGVLALVQTLPDAYPELFMRSRQDHDQLLTLERNEIGGSHAETSVWLLSRWRLPIPVLELVVHAHAAEGQTARRVDEKQARAVALSGPLADLFVLDDPVAAARGVSAQLGNGVALPAAALGDVLESMAAAVPEMAAIFDIALPLGDELTGRVAAIRQILAPGAALPVVRRTKTGNAEDALDDAGKDQLITRYDNAHLEGCLGRICEDASRNKRPLCLAVCDIDNLSTLNAQIGKEAGDRLVKALGQWLRVRLRGRDLAARFDGGGFVLVLVDTPVHGAEIVAERIRREIEETGFEVGIGRPVSITLSVGCALREDPMGARELIASAAAAVRAAKAGGRNRVAISGHERRGAA